MKKRILLITTIASLFILSGCNKVPKLANGQELAAKVNGKDITVEEVYDRLRKQYGTSAVIDIIDNFIAEKEVETDDDAIEMVDFQLEQIKFNFENSGQSFNEALIQNGYKNEQALKDDLIIEYKKSKVVENYFKELLTEKEIEKYYNNEIFGEMDVKHILIKPEEMDNEDEQLSANNKALNKAKDIIKKLNEGAKFEELVKQYSDDEGSVEDGGLIKGVSKDKHVSEFFEASLKLEKNEYTKEPVKSQFGYHIILKVEQKEKPSLKDTKDRIIEDLIDEKMNDGTGQSVQLAWVEIRKKYNLKFFDKDFKNNYNITIDNLKVQQ